MLPKILRTQVMQYAKSRIKEGQNLTRIKLYVVFSSGQRTIL